MEMRTEDHKLIDIVEWLRDLRAENEQLRAALRELVDRWSTERGYDGAIQRARALLLDNSLRAPTTKDVLAALESKP